MVIIEASNIFEELRIGRSNTPFLRELIESKVAAVVRKDVARGGPDIDIAGRIRTEITVADLVIIPVPIRGDRGDRSGAKFKIDLARYTAILVLGIRIEIVVDVLVVVVSRRSGRKTLRQRL